jgi:uncharacterized membrane protein YcaP (DUF421 family)
MFILVVVAMRLMGKRQLGQLQPGELVAMIMMSEIAAMPITQRDSPLIHSVGAILVILLAEIIMALLALKSIKLRDLFGGKPSLVINNGMIMKKTMKRNRITIDELVESLREKDITDLNTVKYAVLERGGVLSVVSQDATLPVILINDGKLLKDNLTFMGVTEEFISDELKNRGITKIKDVFLLMLDEQHNFYIYTQLDVA